MTDLSPLEPDALEADAPPSNAEPYSVSELAFALKRTIESAYGFVRLRGELSKVTFHGNGHVYLDLKDDKACISGVIWKGQVRGLAVRPETGLEVIVTGRVTTYPGRSQYQIIIETMSPAGVGALLAQLERLKNRLMAEGLFDPARKRPLPALPAVIGVITSPTGAVIRDILHRIAERWPCHVLVWPVVVQGDQAAPQVIAAIKGFGALPADGPIARPDLIIVARGGGSVEDLWPFNDEALARAAAASPIPLVSAVGHETDTTLIDFAADRRAPTPTGAAEMATPVRAELMRALADQDRRLSAAVQRRVERGRARLSEAAGRLPRAPDLLAIATQRLDLAAGRLEAALGAGVAAHRHQLTVIAARLRPGLLTRANAERSRTLASLGGRLRPLAERRLQRLSERLASLAQVHASLDPKGPLKRGFAMIKHADGRLARAAASLVAGEAVAMEFHDGERAAIVEGAAPRPRKAAPTPGDQGQLF
jgi:exodeoxyribonuclease VII large subunit